MCFFSNVGTTFKSGRIEFIATPLLVVSRIALVRRLNLLAVVIDFVNLSADGREFGFWES